MLAEFTVALAILLSFIYAPPFGLEHVAKQQTALIIQRISAPFHGQFARRPGQLSPAAGTRSNSKITTGQNAVTVVMIDDAYFRKAAASPDGRTVWPLPVRQLTLGIINRVIRARPRAIFVDLVFPPAPREIVPGGSSSTTESAQALGRYLRELNPPMPVLIGDVINPPEQVLDGPCHDLPMIDADALSAGRMTDQTILNEVAGKANNVHFVNVAGFSEQPGTYPLATAQVGSPRSCETLRRAGRGYLASPALALFKIYVDGCPPAAAADSPCSDERVTRLARLIALDRPAGELIGYDVVPGSRWSGKLVSALSEQWGMALSKPMRTRLENASNADGCIGQGDPGVIEATTSLFYNLFDNPEAEQNRTRCVFIDNVSAADIGTSMFWSTHNPQGSSDKIDIDDQLLRDRVVMIGVDTLQARDYFESPVNGTLPGVYQHAVALENLLSFGSDFHWQDTGRGVHFQLFLILACTLALTVVLRTIAREFVEQSLHSIAAADRFYLASHMVLIGCYLAIVLFILVVIWWFIFSYTDISQLEMAWAIMLVALAFGESIKEAMELFFTHVFKPGNKRVDGIEAAPEADPATPLVSELDQMAKIDTQTPT